MKILRIAILSLALVSTFHSAQVAAEDPCSEWSKQDDGTYLRVCVDDQGHRYCQQKDQDGHITKVPCGG